jgi:hypothetical protein
VTVATSGGGDWRVLLVGERAAGVEGGVATDHEHGVLVSASGDRVSVTLAPREPTS